MIECVNVCVMQLYLSSTTHIDCNFSPLNWKLQSSIRTSVTVLRLTEQDFCLCSLHTIFVVAGNSVSRLGMDTSSGFSGCAICSNSMLDPLGHHAVTYIFGGDIVSRHIRYETLLTALQVSVLVLVEVT